MMIREGLGVDEKNHLVIGGCDAVSLAREHGTPLYVIDEAYLRGMCAAFVGAVREYAPGGMVCYASKAFSTTAMCKIAAQEGMGLDIVSGGELYTAIRAGFPMERVTMHGNAKTPQEVRMALTHGVGHIVIDSQSEISMLEAIAGDVGREVSVLLRMNPGIAAQTHRSVQTAVKDCKFGMGIDDGEALGAVKLLRKCAHLRLTGVHVHIGSQIFDIAPYLQAVGRLMDFMVTASIATGQRLTDLVIGGGFGVRYVASDPPTMNPAETVRAIANEVRIAARSHGIQTPRLTLEPGRIIVAEACVALYGVTSIKDIPGVRTYVGIDGGMTDNPRVALYGGRYEAFLANRMLDSAQGRYAIAGRACESGDVLGMDFPLPRPRIGDILAVPTSGAYQYAMASNYNRAPLPAVLLAKDGVASPIVARQRYEDIVQYDRMPDWLE